ncbi:MULTISPECIES: putative manganese-dependent inorganic diphosphatase [Pseudobutyrivibrio]|uniref:inorganic diphosphatase n=1 Tax=Pseudobutyrivibrio xylanivorans DSM 14809 TaxID=1123012 RepID=A0A1M6DS32_PSEXY|nr:MULTISPECIES: putative manganese-dependent inorganic diphosphatase [Pseudobutyrivibrio]SDH96590.1 manganese-dependent inorganic pyrophosphatase [Pseudobutyrivibrio sp. 49]SFN86751.1 manganese-dependent inorganic pyrophosphatase [Pseudobutyrivibrio sp. UC1225]SHI75993.1 manganese-dependent inorganic pyrophosphatase [Pseudobutyrivibrio xylanivorans DSM 14809]
MPNTVYIIGHKNPDSDSVCAAVAYAYLKNATSNNGTIYEAKKAGQLNEETRYVLERFNIQEPETVMDVGAQLTDIEYRRLEPVDGHISLKKAWELMLERDVATLPVVGKTGKLEGVIVNGDIAYSYMDIYDNSILSRARTQYSNIIGTLNGNLVTGNPHAYFVKGQVVIASSNREDLMDDINVDDLAIVGNITARQAICIEAGCSCLVVCGASHVEPEIIRLAEEHQCVLITTEYDTFTVARLIHQSMPIRQFMQKDDIVSFELDDYVDDVREIMKSVRHRDFPILDENRHYVGMVSRRLLLNMQKKQVILVDHNEKSQAVDGLDQAEVLEIIDHHRLGSLETVSPIYFRNQPVGSTATIVSMMYEEKGVEIPKHIAGVLCSAIISDTLMFRSPTCTPVDEAKARMLADIAGVDVVELATSMFEAGSDFKDKTPDQIFHTDYKIFNSGDINFGVAQVSSISKGQLNSIKDGIKSYMGTLKDSSDLDAVFCMLTDILNQSTELLFVGDDADKIIADAFRLPVSDDSYILEGVVSRKKQLIPPIMESLQE